MGTVVADEWHRSRYMTSIDWITVEGEFDVE